MSVVKSLWAAVQGDPALMRRINGWLTVFWIVMIPISLAAGWLDSVAYVSALSLWALVSGHWSAWQAARVEVKQEQEAEARRAEDLPGDVAAKVAEVVDLPQPRSGTADGRPADADRAH
ncbi:hypothetical protein GCM10010123_35690 [Pilimelia anulata]|uniref:Uncharacterized protein n=1 Tax=Pilimelia anulata TaxID=53371 RepID=A0A8J3BF01_9ACTN|nr:hypothetical protein [Pilimelia anulata]GGK02621.1 hypothetical protein GCM10010123_35690 [Pilimelia anulata]